MNKAKDYSVVEFCKVFGISLRTLVKAHSEGRGPKMVDINGEMFVSGRSGEKWAAKQYEKIKYDTSVRDADAYNSAVQTFVQYAALVGQENAGRLLRKRFGVKRIDRLDVAHQKLMTDFFGYRIRLLTAKGGTNV